VVNSLSQSSISIRNAAAGENMSLPEAVSQSASRVGSAVDLLVVIEKSYYYE